MITETTPDPTVTALDAFFASSKALNAELGGDFSDGCFVDRRDTEWCTLEDDRGDDQLYVRDDEESDWEPAICDLNTLHEYDSVVIAEEGFGHRRSLTYHVFDAAKRVQEDEESEDDADDGEEDER